MQDCWSIKLYFKQLDLFLIISIDITLQYFKEQGNICISLKPSISLATVKSTSYSLIFLRKLPKINIRAAESDEGS